MEKLKPREKLQRFGPAQLTDLELLRILIGSGNQQVSAEQIAKHLLRLLKKQGDAITYQEVSSIPGMGPAKTCEIVALFELGRRYLLPADRPVITSSDEAFRQLEYLKDKKQEYFVVLTLDGANRLIDNAVIFQGTLNQSLIHPREIFAKAIEDRAAAIIVAHNHPSGNLDPSADDEEVTEKLVQAGQLLGIDVLDHLIVAKSGYRSINGR
ncbi:DNA repair protein RadC [uncultured Enorma sp.]|uniref:RadC family protein n=1 Tax=uncultured Enorma sp. TaxID=1714346 RepID=UPI00265FEADF|nr:DNA repair protein RadC [uncultured Enorma sp.]